MNVSKVLTDLLHQALDDLKYPDTEITLESPPDPKMGDRSCTIALALAKQLKRAPRQIAEEIRDAIKTDGSIIERIEIAGAGYLNFFCSEEVWLQLLQSILSTGPDYGSSDTGKNEKRLFEFVSANPTGPMNIVSARAAALGDSMVRLQKKVGFSADSEFYVNDSGKQIRLLGESVQARARELQGETAEIPDGGYHGAYIKDLAKRALDESAANCLEVSAELTGRWAADKLREGQEATLEEYGVKFDRWFRESELYTDNSHQKTLERLKANGHIYEKDGALFFRTTEFGDDEDRVVITSDGRPTYFLPDIAYHLNKAERGYVRVFDLLGPDHHGHGKRMQAAMKAAGMPDDFLEIIIVQQVNLLRGGEPVKMSKRTGEMVTMKELLDEVGADAARQIFLSRKWSSHLDFDIESAKDRSEKSPVFYVQYAHARICSIFRKAGDRGDASLNDLEKLKAAEERNLMRSLSLFPDVVESAALYLAPHRLNTYLGDLATAFHHFYHECRVISEDEGLTRARLALCRAVQIALIEGLRLMGMTAPERM